VEILDCERAAVPVVAGQEAHRREVRRDIERLGGEGPLKNLPPVTEIGQRAVGEIAVELDIDGGKGSVSAGHIGLRFQREPAETAARGRRRSRPAQGLAKRVRVCRKRSFEFQRGAIADIAVEAYLERRCGEPKLESGSLARERGEEITQTERGIDRLV